MTKLGFICMAGMMLAQQALSPIPPLSVKISKPSFAGVIVRVHETAYGSIVVLDAGSYEGLRAGAVCGVFRGEVLTGHLILVEVSENVALGLVVDQKKSAGFRSGDIVRLKVEGFD